MSFHVNSLSWSNGRREISKYIVLLYFNPNLLSFLSWSKSLNLVRFCSLEIHGLLIATNAPVPMLMRWTVNPRNVLLPPHAKMERGLWSSKIMTPAVKLDSVVCIPNTLFGLNWIVVCFHIQEVVIELLLCIKHYAG